MFHQDEGGIEKSIPGAQDFPRPERFPKSKAGGKSRGSQNSVINSSPSFSPILPDPQKITILGETKSDKIVTRIFTKYGDLFITSIITNSGRQFTRIFLWFGDNLVTYSIENVLGLLSPKDAKTYISWCTSIPPMNVKGTRTKVYWGPSVFVFVFVYLHVWHTRASP